MGLVLWKSIQWDYYTYPHTLRGQIHVKKDPQKLRLKTLGDSLFLFLLNNFGRLLYLRLGVIHIFSPPKKKVSSTTQKKKSKKVKKEKKRCYTN